MSLSSRKRARDLTIAAGVMAGALGSTARAAQFYYQPIVTLSTSYNTNVDLDPHQKQGAEGYFADAATNIGIATPDSETTLQPRLLYNYFPTASHRNRLEAFLNLNGRYSWQRDRFNISGFFDHRDDINAQQPSAEANPVNPGLGDTPATTGQTQAGITRNYTILDPTYTHLLTPLSSIGIAGEYQRLDYSPANTSNHIDFNYYQARAFYAKTLDLRTDFALGLYGSRYQAQSIDSHSTSEGVQFNGGYNWSQVLHSSLTVQVQHTHFQETSPHVLDVSTNPWAANLTTVYTEQISSYRLVIGRSIYPSSAGGLYTTDQVRGQYDRDLTQRLHFMGAVRYFRDRTTAGVTTNDTRNYATATVRFEYLLTRTFFVAGNYTFTYQKYHFDPSSAEANLVGIAFGYRGLERQH